jgi:rod shape-determining protein MreD
MTGPQLALTTTLVLVAQLVDVAVLDRLPVAGATVDLLLLVVVVAGLGGGGVHGGVVGACAGLLADLTPPAAGLLGVNALAYGLAGVVAGRWYRPGGRTADRPLALSLLAVAVAAMLMTAVHVVVGLGRLSTHDAAVTCAGAAGLAVAVGTVVLPVLTALDRRVAEQLL